MVLARRRLPLLAVPLALLAMPAMASAATTADKTGGGVLTLTGTGSEQSGMTVTLANGVFTITDSTGMADQDPECSQVDGDTVTCTTAGVTSLRIELGDGNDGFSSDIATPATVLGGGGNDTVQGGTGTDDLEGDDGVDTLSGGDGHDEVDGGAGNDSMRGQAGDDLIQAGPGPQGPVADSDEIDGGDGIDHVTYGPRSAAVNVTLDAQRNDGAAGELDDVQGDVEQVTGGTAGDVLAGNSGANRLNGGPGGDRLTGEAGDDALDGGGDADVTDGGDGNDSVAGGAGPDEVSGGAGDDTVDGSVAGLVGVDGADRVAGGAGSDRLFGGDADDALDGGAGADAMAGGPGIDTALYASPPATARLGAAGVSTGNVRVSLDDVANDGLAKEGDNVGSDVENTTTGDGNDTLLGSAGGNGLTSGAGQDYLVGNQGPDVLAAGSSGDVVRARDTRPDTIDCGGGVDFAILDKTETATSGCEFLDKGGRRPRLGRRFVLRPLRGGQRLGFGAPGMTRWAPLEETLLLPTRARVRARGGAVRLVSATRRGSQSAVLSKGAFVVRQRRSGRGLTDLVLAEGDFGSCGAPSARGKTSAAGSRRVRRLFGRGRGRFRTRGRNSSATVRGTRWSVTDRCDGTLTTVSKGTVRVRDFGLRRTIVLTAGERYLAKARRR